MNSVLSGSPEALRSRAALVVDDVLLHRVVVAVALRQLGYQVTQAIDGEEALRRLNGANFDVVCLDWNMPGLNGDEIARRIATMPHAPPVVAITADDSPEIKDQIRNAGAVGYLSKNFTQHELAALLEQILPGSNPDKPRPSPGTGGESPTRKLLLGRSQEQFSSERIKFGRALEERRTESALRALHNIVSLAGLVGALSIHAAAQKLETRLRLGGSFKAELTALDASLGNFKS